ncbi:hypothetical protein PTTG_03435 [Puccinia triticina 1-1 BBBD Race 1]|uniref:Septin-type G domain-containing protein n=2 Tax=Puccinia triticina TaxID=208348 RepID=A0A0C4ERL6_PUCT1|nr:uncharacterized protein PtA15_7A714 [Puccinia triticina]OAV96208.1 hypothetical protein PTTG_03435 [Puccinia triticina 1-1 BBBD Race 1]WAQ86985.1 hypothetical protein PtA15_7A714 [Puccinia triticina]WAR56845.1 hypothetical protein PtB15_7B696 [Puccinia triticina]
MPPGPARRKKSVKKGLGFTLMVVGASGTGRTTFVNTLVDQKGWLPHADSSDPIAAAEGTSHIKVEKKTIELDEDGVTIRLTVCDAPGFGDNIDNESAFSTIIGYLEKQYDDILAEESRIKRNPRFEDQRIHALLYFIPPTGHSLREMDIELMRRLSPRVNVIPVIGKADTLTPSELKGFKDRIMQDIEHYEIPIYNFPFDAEEDDDEVVAENSELRALLPFAIVGSENEIEVGGELVRAREYPWGVVEVDNPAHSDFLRLRTALLSSHLTDLKEITHDFLYENYRTQTLSRGDADQLDQSIQPEDMANQSFRLKEEQLKKEEEKLKEIELRVQREISEKRQELLAKEESLRNMEARLAHASSGPLDG